MAVYRDIAFSAILVGITQILHHGADGSYRALNVIRVEEFTLAPVDLEVHVLARKRKGDLVSGTDRDRERQARAPLLHRETLGSEHFPVLLAGEGQLRAAVRPGGVGIRGDSDGVSLIVRGDAQPGGITWS